MSNTGGVPSYLMPTAAARSRQVNVFATESTRRAVSSTTTRKSLINSRLTSLTTTSRTTRPAQPKYEPLFAGMKLDVYEFDEDDTFRIEV
ncbi:hypothetical protein SAICODRAFT_30157 [Saitoella complicata NRRL Y-17804]|uniref:uncharacterized protein n=1 Tax=Saitoella complicata (strain BCRC 22490 / CBS 7301 / JCM 7358 / NBRC 10748 / NRRL Y-17804) TaxID=698492 RepID=UPI000867F78C|nr:uncharacterized protein SAICODRAFT_30157 [Saitoella complicata NRRL Y-17804]ODQ53478.1 hypothetical protein SAICODRAFT_30157 [Saitoella complicata NRRL Y-17804]